MKSGSEPAEVDQSDVCTIEMLEEQRKKAQIANATINQKNEIIEELGKNFTSLENDFVLLEDEVEQKDAKNAQLAAHISFLGLGQRCS